MEKMYELKFLTHNFGLKSIEAKPIDKRAFDNTHEHDDCLIYMDEQGYFTITTDEDSYEKERKELEDMEKDLCNITPRDLRAYPSLRAEEKRINKEKNKLIRGYTRFYYIDSAKMQPEHVKRAWPFSSIYGDYKMFDYVPPVIVNPAQTIIHIETRLFVLFYVAKTDQLVFRNRNLCNEEYLAKKFGAEKAEDARGLLKGQKIIDQRIDNIVTAQTIYDEQEVIPNHEIRTSRSQLFANNAKGKVTDYEWLVNYSIDNHCHHQVSKKFCYLMTMAAMICRYRERCVRRTVNLLLFLNCDYILPHDIYKRRTRTKVIEPKAQVVKANKLFLDYQAKRANKTAAHSAKKKTMSRYGNKR